MSTWNGSPQRELTKNPLSGKFGSDHGASQDGSTEWPGFLLAGPNAGLDAADAKVLGVTSSQDYKGISISMGDSYTANPYVPRLVISQYP